jgi:hypothetical protein
MEVQCLNKRKWTRQTLAQCHLLRQIYRRIVRPLQSQRLRLARLLCLSRVAQIPQPLQVILQRRPAAWIVW